MLLLLVPRYLGLLVVSRRELRYRHEDYHSEVYFDRILE